MAVETSFNFNRGTFVPFAQRSRGGESGAVGTVAIDEQITGAAGGGAATLNIDMGKTEFGFRILYVPTFIGVRDNLATAENVSFSWVATGNKRLPGTATFAQNIVSTQVSGVNLGLADTSGMLIEGREIADARILRFVWETNTDTKIYHVHVFGTAYDLEWIEKYGVIGPVLEGIR